MLEGIDCAADRGAPGRQLHRAPVREGPDASRRRSARKASRLALAAVSRDDDAVLAECADLLYHLLVLLHARGLSLARAVAELTSRHEDKTRSQSTA